MTGEVVGFFEGLIVGFFVGSEVGFAVVGLAVGFKVGAGQLS